MCYSGSLASTSSPCILNTNFDTIAFHGALLIIITPLLLQLSFLPLKQLSPPQQQLLTTATTSVFQLETAFYDHASSTIQTSSPALVGSLPLMTPPLPLPLSLLLLLTLQHNFLLLLLFLSTTNSGTWWAQPLRPSVHLANMKRPVPFGVTFGQWT